MVRPGTRSDRWVVGQASVEAAASSSAGSSAEAGSSEAGSSANGGRLTGTTLEDRGVLLGLLLQSRRDTGGLRQGSLEQGEQPG